MADDRDDEGGDPRILPTAGCRPQAADDEGGQVVAGPFGGLSARDAALRSVEVRRRNAERRALDAQQLSALARARVAELPGRAELAGLAYAVVMQAAVGLLNGEIPIRKASEAKEVASIFCTIARLESGEPTGITESLTREARLALVKDLQQRAAERGIREVTGTGTNPGA